jgi:chromosomal replication initiation ATPase DnaA
MNPSQAWQAALGQLQMEMPKSAFDTWVRNTQFVSFEEKIFTISTQNDYAKEWLTDRLTTTVVKLLTGIMNQTVDVRFTVAELEDQPEDVDDGDIADVEAIFDLPYDDIVGSGIIAIPGKGAFQAGATPRNVCASASILALAR